MDDGTNIDIPQLTALGDDVAEVGTRLARAANDIEGWRNSAAGAVEGSATCDVQLALLADHWRSSLGMLARVRQGRTIRQLETIRIRKDAI